jgi:hypothetical protein
MFAGKAKWLARLLALTVLAVVGLVLVGQALTRTVLVGPAPTPSLVAGFLPSRLLEPTLPSSPTTADLGSRIFWLDCMPCHGDRGQGLTDEFRQLYPTEDRNCWASGCHGERPYENGFTLPARVPAVIGPGALDAFGSVAALDAYIRAAMPRQKPGSLAPTEYDQVVAFLARENGLSTGAMEATRSEASAGSSRVEALRPHFGSGASPSLGGWWLALGGTAFSACLLALVARALARRRAR